MKSRTSSTSRAWIAAATGTALGVAGLAVIAMPAGAGEAPELPEISATELVESALSAEPTGFAGTVGVDNALGLPDISGLPLAGFDSAQVHHDGEGRARVGVQRGSSEYTVVKDADGVWTYDSAENTATRHTKPEAASEHRKHADEPELSDPAAAATTIIDKLSETSTVSIDGTARVADRPVYELVLTPKPSERTLLREVKVSIDYDTRLPLKFEVLPNGSPDPVVSVGFTEFTVGEQPESLFDFSPPKGAKVVEEDGSEHAEAAKEHSDEAAAFGERLDVVGDGWDTVLTGTLPEELPNSGRGGQSDPRALLERVGKPVEGKFGTGYVITTRAGTGLVTDDGRFAVGAVPQQVLIEALEAR